MLAHDEGYHVFALKPAHRQPGAGVKQYATRRTHKKSRAGCLTCRQKRVKCDERQPSCMYCSRRNLDCTYETSPPARRGSDYSSSEEPHTPVSPAESDALVQVESPARPLETASTEMLLYNHYEIMTANGLLLGVEHEKYHRRVLSLAQDV